MADLSKISVVLPSLDPDEKLNAVIDGLLEYGFTDIILPRHNIQGLDTSKYRINIHPVRKVEEALRELFG